MAAFPYGLASKENQTIYSEDSVPEGFTLSDPDHLTGSQIETLYLHWRNRQQKKLSPFVILNASPQHQATVKKMSAKAKGKRKIDYVPVSSSEDERDSDGEDGVDNGEGDDVEADQEDQEENEVDEEDQEEKEMTPPVKRGPPNRKVQKIQSPKAGSSKLPPPPSPKKSMKIKRPLTKIVDEEEPIASSSKLATPPPNKSLKMKQTKNGEASKRQGTAAKKSSTLNGKTEAGGKQVCY
jgi:hypothetical protein